MTTATELPVRKTFFAKLLELLYVAKHERHRKAMRTARVNLLLALVGMLACPGSWATTVDELAELQRQRDAEQAKRDIATARAEESKAKIGSLDTSTLPKGSGEAASLNVEGKILAYRAMDAAATKIVDQIVAIVPKPAALVIYSETELKAVLQYRGFVQQATLLEQQATRITTGASGSPSLPRLESDTPCNAGVDTVLPSDEGGGGIGVLSAVGVGLQLLSLFKTDQKVVGSDVSLDEFALTASVVGKLLAVPIRVVYPPSFLPGAFSPTTPPAQMPQVLKHLDTLTSTSGKLDQLGVLITQRRDTITKLGAAPKLTPDCKSSYARDLTALANLEATAKVLKSTVEQVTTALTKTDDKGGPSALQALVNAETLASHFSAAPYVLQLKPIAAGGATLTKTNFFSTKFFFSGGAIITYMLYSGTSGEIVVAGTVPSYGGYVAAGDLSAAP